MINQSNLIQQVTTICTDFCAALTLDEVETFIRYVDVVDVRKNSIIADIGDVEDHFYLVIGGVVHLFQHDQMRDIEVGRIEPGELVGEMSFFDHQPRTIRLRADKKGAKLLKINRPMYKRLTIEHPFIAVNLLELIILSLDKLIRNTSRDISVLHQQIIQREENE